MVVLRLERIDEAHPLACLQLFLLQFVNVLNMLGVDSIRIVNLRERFTDRPQQLETGSSSTPIEEVVGGGRLDDVQRCLLGKPVLTPYSLISSVDHPVKLCQGSCCRIETSRWLEVLPLRVALDL